MLGQYLMSLLMLVGCGGGFGSLAMLRRVLGPQAWGTRDARFIIGFPLFLGMAVAFVWISAVVMARSKRWVEAGDGAKPEA